MNSFVASPKPDAPVPAGPAFGDQGKAPDEPEAFQAGAGNQRNQPDFSFSSALAVISSYRLAIFDATS